MGAALYPLIYILTPVSILKICGRFLYFFFDETIEGWRPVRTLAEEEIFRLGLAASSS